MGMYNNLTIGSEDNEEDVEEKKGEENRRMVSLCWYCLPLSPASSGNNWNGESKGWIESNGGSNLSSMNGRLQLDRQGKQTRMGNWEEEGEGKGSLVRRDGREGGILLSSDKTIDCVLPSTDHLFEIRTNTRRRELGCPLKHRGALTQLIRLSMTVMGLEGERHD